MGKNPDPGSGMNIPDLIFVNLVSVSQVKINKILRGGSGSEIFVNTGYGSRHEKHRIRAPGYGMFIPDPQHWYNE
jgi:hypothetical protein